MLPVPLRILFLCGLAAAGCTRPSGDVSGPVQGAPAAAEGGQRAVLVRVAPLEVRDIARRLETTATIESLEMVDVMPERSERVAEIRVEEGDPVEAGTVLAMLRDDDAQLAVDEAAVRVEETRVAMEQARRNHDRNLRLAQSSRESGTVLVSESDLEASQQALDAATTSHHAAEVALERAELALAQCALRSPIDGTVTARDLSVGDMATVGARAFQVIDLSRPKVVFYRPQRELPLLAVGQELVATSEALPGVDIRGRIERIAPMIDQTTGTVKVVAGLEASGRVLPPGVLVELVLELDRHEGALLVPKRALLYEGRTISCFAVREGVARRIVIRPGYEDGEYLEAAGETDLREDDEVVVVGQDRLADGDPVERAAE